MECLIRRNGLVIVSMTDEAYESFIETLALTSNGKDSFPPDYAEELLIALTGVGEHPERATHPR